MSVGPLISVDYLFSTVGTTLNKGLFNLFTVVQSRVNMEHTDYERVKEIVHLIQWSHWPQFGSFTLPIGPTKLQN